jgi:hypothetical protein
MRDHGAGRLLPRWVMVFFIAAAIVLIPWIVLLFGDTSAQFGVAKHARLVWGGFDCFLVVGFAVTAYRIATRSPRGAITAAATGTMLLVDAWFDILTARRPSAQLTAILMAVFAEIPCALICFFVARRIVHLFEQVRPYLAAEGFRVVDGQLVPPADAAELSEPTTSEAAMSDAEMSEGAVSDPVPGSGLERRVG